MFNFKQFWELSYLFDPTPGGQFRYFWPLFIFFLLAFLSSFLIKKKIQTHPQKKLLKKLFKKVPFRLKLLGAIGILFLLIRLENLPYLSIRFFLLAFIFYFLFYLGQNIYRYFKKYPLELERFQKYLRQKRYLPRK